MRFRDRADAGRQLAEHLRAYANRSDVIVLALPRGGVPVAREVAAALAAPLDVLLVRKLGVPGHPELAMGAIALGGVRVLSEDLISELDIPRATVEQVSVREHVELDRRNQMYRGSRPFPALDGRTVIVVDDGLATGATAEAAVVALRDRGAERIVVAAPLGSPATCARLEAVADAVVCAAVPDRFYAVGSWYDRFDQTTDEEVIAILEGELVAHPRSPIGDHSSS
jgi:putative phosphoribosyl transferase